MHSPPAYVKNYDPGVTNIWNVGSPHWRLKGRQIYGIGNCRHQLVLPELAHRVSYRWQIIKPRHCPLDDMRCSR